MRVPLVAWTVLAVVATYSLCGGAEPKVEEAQLETKAGRLHGTLDVPPGAEPCPALLVIAGSGPTDRDGNQPRLMNDSLKQLGKGLASEGLAVLRYDKRGIGQSILAGRREEDLRFEDYVNDAVEWVRFLRRNRRFSKIGIVGHSEGSLTGMLAAKQIKVDAFFSLSAPGRPAATLIREQIAKDPNISADLRLAVNQVLQKLVTGETVQRVPAELNALFRPSVQPYLISWFKYDPAVQLSSMTVPALLIHGANDLQVSTENARLLSLGNPKAELKVIPEMNHVLKRAITATDQQAAYTNPALPIDQRVVQEIVGFLKREGWLTVPRR